MRPEGLEPPTRGLEVRLPRLKRDATSCQTLSDLGYDFLIGQWAHALRVDVRP